MKKGFIAVAALTAVLCSQLARADGSGVSVKVGTLGYGAEFTAATTSMTNVRFGINRYSYDKTTMESDINYKLELDLKSGDLLLDWHPFSGTFRLTAGVVYNKNEFTVTAEPAASYNIGGATYTSAQVGTLTGKVTFKKTAPYLGVGWGNAAKGKGLSFGADLGILFQGSPDVKLTATGSVVTAASLAQEEQDAEGSMSDYDRYPVIAFGLTYKF